MTEFKWRDYPDTMPRLPVDDSRQSDKYLVTVLYKDGKKQVDMDYIKSNGTWVRYPGTSRSHVIAWMYCPLPYDAADQQRLF